MKPIISLLFIYLLNYNTVSSQRDFVNPAITDPAPCSCDIRTNRCDLNCCCDPDCHVADLSISSICNGQRTTGSYSVPEEASQNAWNCTNIQSSTYAYDYFPFVCYQFKMNEVLGRFHKTQDVKFASDRTTSENIRTQFVTEYQELFQSTLTDRTSGRYINNESPVLTGSSNILELPGTLGGMNCQNGIPVKFGVNRDVTCTQSSINSNLCNYVNGINSILATGESTSQISISLVSATYTAPTTTTTRNGNQEYYLQAPTNNSINDFTSTSIPMFDFCPGRHPIDRVQRYHFCGTPETSLCSDGNLYQTYPSCRERNSFAYSNFPDRHFYARSASTDDPTNFADFNNGNGGPNITCGTNADIRRIYYRFTYSSMNNQIFNVTVYVLTSTNAANMRINVEWIDIYNSTESTTTIPAGYKTGDVLKFRRNSLESDISMFVPGTNGLCVDATRRVLRYKESTASTCFVQIQRQTIEQCHDLKLNMYLYLNTHAAPASSVFPYANTLTSPIIIRDDSQEARDLNLIDIVRPDNRLTPSMIRSQRLRAGSVKLYDTAPNLPLCFNVPSGIYVEFGYIRLQIGPADAFERIVSVQYRHKYSDWKFDCTISNCSEGTTQLYPITIESTFVDYTSRISYRPDVTKSDFTAADNYIEHLLWLITPEYKGEPGYRNFTTAMILIFIAICGIVLHVLMFGWMIPF